MPRSRRAGVWGRTGRRPRAERVICPHPPAGPGVPGAAPRRAAFGPLQPPLRAGGTERHQRCAPVPRAPSRPRSGAVPAPGSGGHGRTRGGERGFPAQSGHGTPRASSPPFRIPPRPGSPAGHGELHLGARHAAGRRFQRSRSRHPRAGAAAAPRRLLPHRRSGRARGRARARRPRRRRHRPGNGGVLRPG